MGQLLRGSIVLLLVAKICTPAFAITIDLSKPPVSVNEPASAPAAQLPINSNSDKAAKAYGLSPVIKDFLPKPNLDGNSEFGGWKSVERYEIQQIVGLQDAYYSGDPIVFSVKGNAPNLAVEAENGFSVAAAIIQLPSEKYYMELGTYDNNNHSWQVKIMKSYDNTKEYELVITLYCDKYNSACDNLYGFGSHVEKHLKLHIY